jgi:DNA-binding MarR family transcriptional regulator
MEMEWEADSATDNALGAGPLSPALAPWLGYLLRRAYVRSLGCVPETLPADRHPADMAVLTAVEALGPASQRLLGQRLAINRTVMVQIVDRLETEGLVARNRDPRDRRSYAVALTDTGRRALATWDRHAAAHTACLARNLTAAQGRRLNELLAAALASPDGGLAEMPAKLGERTGFLVARAHFVMRSQAKARLAPLGVEPQHFGALAVLDDTGPRSQQRLAGDLGVSGTMVVQLVDHLEDEGLVERRRDPGDRRVHLLTLTAEGTRTLAACYRVAEEVTAQFTAPLGADGADELRRLLLRLVDG